MCHFMNTLKKLIQLSKLFKIRLHNYMFFSEKNIDYHISIKGQLIKNYPARAKYFTNRIMNA